MYRCFLFIIYKPYTCPYQPVHTLFTPYINTHCIQYKRYSLCSIMTRPCTIPLLQIYMHLTKAVSTMILIPATSCQNTHCNAWCQTTGMHTSLCMVQCPVLDGSILDASILLTSHYSAGLTALLDISWPQSQLALQFDRKITKYKPIFGKLLMERRCYQYLYHYFSGRCLL